MKQKFDFSKVSKRDTRANVKRRVQNDMTEDYLPLIDEIFKYGGVLTPILLRYCPLIETASGMFFAFSDGDIEVKEVCVNVFTYTYEIGMSSAVFLSAYDVSALSGRDFSVRGMSVPDRKEANGQSKKLLSTMTTLCHSSRDMPKLSIGSSKEDIIGAGCANDILIDDNGDEEELICVSDDESVLTLIQDVQEHSQVDILTLSRAQDDVERKNIMISSTSTGVGPLTEEMVQEAMEWSAINTLELLSYRQVEKYDFRSSETRSDVVVHSQVCDQEGDREKPHASGTRSEGLMIRKQRKVVGGGPSLHCLTINCSQEHDDKVSQIVVLNSLQHYVMHASRRHEGRLNMSVDDMYDILMQISNTWFLDGRVPIKSVDRRALYAAYSSVKSNIWRKNFRLTVKRREEDSLYVSRRHEGRLSRSVERILMQISNTWFLDGRVPVKSNDRRALHTVYANEKCITRRKKSSQTLKRRSFKSGVVREELDFREGEQCISEVCRCFKIPLGI